MVRPPGFLDRLSWRLGILDRHEPVRVNPRGVGTVIAIHLLALLACIPWLFSWSGLIIGVVSFYLFGVLGINVGYHRLLTHRSFACPRWLERTLAVLGACSWQGTPIGWVAVHRMHHQHSDDPADPHTPRHGFFWSHMGWFMVIDPAIQNISTYDRYARDLFQDRFFKWMERPRATRLIRRIQWMAYLFAGALVGGLATESWEGAAQLGLSWLVWGVMVRNVAAWHITWSVNSFTHIWGGYRNFETDDDSRNNWILAIFTSGEGWHNNHHAEPRSASHGMRWWEYDLCYSTIRLLEVCGLAWNVIRPGWRRKLQPPEAIKLEPPEKARIQPPRLAA